MKRYLITGASRGIGRAIAEKLAAKDVELLLHGRDTVALAQTRKAVESQCAKVALLIHDLANSAGVSDLIAEVGNEPIHLLVNNAGVAVVAAKRGFPNWSAYCMSKFALEGFSQCVREELRDRKIRVINIYPAATDTEIWDQIQGKWPRQKMISPEEVASAVAYAMSRAADVALENITLSSLTGNL